MRNTTSPATPAINTSRTPTKRTTFDVDSYLSSLRRKRRRVITEDEPFDLYDIELSDEDFAAE